MKSQRVKEICSAFKDYKTSKNFLINDLDYVFQSNCLRSGPQIVDVVITKKCNLDCCFCKKYESGIEEMSLENFEILAAQLLPDARKLNFCSGGEPFMHKKFIDILRIAKRYNVWISVVSNGMLLRDDIVKKIVNEELIDALAFSIDGVLPETVESIRVNANLAHILNNIKMLIHIKNKHKKPSISIRYALMEKNIEELSDAVSFWGESDISQIICNYLSLCNGIDKAQSLYYHLDITEKCFQDATRKAKEYPDLSLTLPPLIRDKKESNNGVSPAKCKYPWMFAMIDADGRLFPCYNSWGAIEMGNIFSDNISFREIWNNQNYCDLRRTVNNDSLKKKYSYCAICPSRFGVQTKELHFGDELFFKNLDIEKHRLDKMMALR